MAALFAQMPAANETPFQPGTSVERIIDDVWYRGVLGAVDAEIEEAQVVYDDGNAEVDVSFDDLRIVPPGEPGSNSGGNIGDCAAAAGNKARRVETLPKPLAGLVEDDCEDRKSHATLSVVHNSADTEEAIILNGAENELAAGGGLRALRFIRKKGP